MTKNKPLQILMIVLVTLAMLVPPAPARASGETITFTSISVTANSGSISTNTWACTQVDARTITCTGAADMYDGGSASVRIINVQVNYAVSTTGVAIYTCFSGGLSGPPSNNATPYYHIATGASITSQTTAGQVVHNATLTNANSRMGGTVGSSGSYVGTVTNSGTITISLDPCATCAAQFPVQGTLVDGHTINPVVASPNAYPAPDQIYSGLTPGEVIMLTVSGGPWNDGATNKYSSQLSFDNGATWQDLSAVALEEYVICVSEDPLNPDLMQIVMYAPSGSIQIRVDDVNIFADNTGSLVWSLYSVLGRNGCGAQFTYNETLDLIDSGTLEAWDDSNPAIPALTELTVGSYYLLVTEDGPWLDNFTEPQYDIAVTEDVSKPQIERTYYPLVEGSTWPALLCHEIADDGLHHEAYFQAVTPSLMLRVNNKNDLWMDNDDSIGWRLYRVTYNPMPTVCESTFGIGEELGTNIIYANRPNGVELSELNVLPKDDLDKAAGGGEDPKIWTRFFRLTITQGPWYNGPFPSNPSYEVQISDDRETWHRLMDWEGSWCVTRRGYETTIYFSAAKDKTYYVRVFDPGGLYADNTDNPTFSNILRYRLEQASLFDIYDEVTGTPDPTPGYCDTYFTASGTPSATVSIPATSPVGAAVTGLTSGTRYKISISGTWRNDGAAPDLQTLDISDDGSTWTPLLNYPGVLCAADEGSTVTVWLTAISGANYRLRVNDTGSLWSINTGTMTATWYPETSTIIAPWESCADGYWITAAVAGSTASVPQSAIEAIWSMANPVMFGSSIGNAARAFTLNELGGALAQSIPANNANGVQMPAPLTVGQKYAIQIYGGPWADTPGGDDRHDAAISLDNGATWYPLGDTVPGVFCSVNIVGSDNVAYTMIYFDATVATGIRLRVNDAGEHAVGSGDETADFIVNTGSLDYAVWRVTAEGDTLYQPGAPTNGTVSTVWTVGCTAAPQPPAPAQAPESLLDVTGWLGYIATRIMDLPGWIVYSVARVVWWATWCPEHTAALQLLPSLFMQREPLRTIREILGLVTYVQQEVESYEWINPDTPESIITSGGGFDAPQDLFGASGTNPWNGGPLIDTSGGGFGFGTMQTPEQITALQDCEQNLSAVIGYTNPIGAYFCMARGWTAQTGVDRWYQSLWDLGIIVFTIFFVLALWGFIKIGGGRDEE